MPSIIACTTHCHFTAKLALPHRSSVSVSFSSSWPRTKDNLPVSEHHANGKAGLQDYELFSDYCQRLLATFLYRYFNQAHGLHIPKCFINFIPLLNRKKLSLPCHREPVSLRPIQFYSQQRMKKQCWPCSLDGRHGINLPPVNHPETLDNYVHL